MKNANHFIGVYNGSDNFFRHRLSGLVYTDGVKALAEQCQAYWLIDLICSHQMHATVHTQPFQVWDLQRKEGDSFSIRCTDGNYNHITSQDIPFSDFPFDLATVWVVDKTLMLPTEY